MTSVLSSAEVCFLMKTMNSKVVLFLGLLLASALVVSWAAQVEEATDVNKEVEEQVEPAYCRYRCCCKSGGHGCVRNCCRSTQAEAGSHSSVGEQEVEESEEPNEIEPNHHRGGGGGYKGGGGKGGGHGGYGGGGGRGGGGYGHGGKGGRGGGGGGGYGGGRGGGGGGYGGGGRGGGGGGGKGGNAETAKP